MIEPIKRKCNQCRSFISSSASNQRARTVAGKPGPPGPPGERGERGREGREGKMILLRSVNKLALLSGSYC